MIASSSIFLSPLHLSHPKPNLFSNFQKQSLPIFSPLALPSTRTLSNHKLPFFPPNPTQIWRISAIPNSNFLISEANPVGATTEQLVTTTNDVSSNVVSVLVFLAFVGLSVLTIGVIYIGVTDFLQKRENEKIDKQDAIVNVKNSGRKLEQEVPSPPRGYRRNKLGQKKTVKQPKPKPKPKPKPMPKQADKKPKPKPKPKQKSRGK